MKTIVYTAFLSCILIGCAQNKNNKEVNTSNAFNLTKQNEKNFSITTVKRVANTERLNAAGEISFDEDNVVRVYPIVSGSVEKVYVSLGDYVKKGQLLATILSTDISQYQRDYNIAKTNLEIANKNLERYKALYNTNVISEKELAEAQRDFTNAQSEFNEKKQILALYGGSSSSLDATFNVVAPNNGYIVERTINEGTQIRTDNQTNLFTISDLKTIWVWANIYESDLSRVREGDSVEVNTVAFPNQPFYGKITKVGTMLDPATRVVRVRTELSNESGQLKPEMSASVSIFPTNATTILAVPTQAIVLLNGKFYVMKQTQSASFEKVEVKTGKTVGTFTEILEGVAEGDSILTENALLALTAQQLKQ